MSICWITSARCGAPMLLAALLCATSEANTVLYSQPPNATDVSASQTDGNAGARVPAATYENFTLSADAWLNQFIWIGEYEAGKPSLSRFTLQISIENASDRLFSTSVTSNRDSPLGICLQLDPNFSYDATALAAKTSGAPTARGWQLGSGGDRRFFYVFPNSSSNFILADLAFNSWEAQRL